MRSSERLVPALLCAAALLAVPACNNSGGEGGETASTVEPTKAPQAQTPPTQTPPTQTPPVQTPASTTPPVTPVADATPPKPAVPTPTPAPEAATPQARSLAPSTDMIGVVVEPERVDLGDIPTNDAATGIVTLTNLGDTPRTLLDCKTSCGCTTTNCQKGKELAPGESVEVEVKLNGGQRPTTLSKTVTFLISDQPPIQLPVTGSAVAFVVVEPERLIREQHPEGRIVVRAVDDEPFTIKSMYPPVLTPDQFSKEPASEHELFLSWDLLKEQGARATKLQFTLDHPKTRKAMGVVDARGLIDAPQNPNETPAPPVQVTRFDLDKLLKDAKTDEILRLLDEGEIDVTAIDSFNQTPLIKAARWGNLDVLYALLDAGSDVSQGDQISRTPLMYAVRREEEAKDRDKYELVVALLDAGADLEAADQLGNTALCWAAGFGTPQIVKELIDAGARVEVVPAMTGFTPLIWAAGFGDPENIKLLIDAGANIEAADVMQGSTPLMNAVRTGGVENVRALLEAGANIEARDAQGKTPLLFAVSNAGPDAELVQALLDAGADVLAKSGADEDVVTLARRRTDLRSAEVIALVEKAYTAAGGVIDE